MELSMSLTLWELLVLPLPLFLVLLVDMLELVDMLPTPLVPSMLPRERPRPMLGFSMEVMDMVLAMLVLAMPDMVILPMATMAKGLLMLNQKPRLMLDFSMEDMDMDLVLAMLDMAMESQLMDTLLLATTVKDLLMPMLDIFMVATDMDLVLAMVLDTVDTTTDKLAAATCKSSKAIICYSVPIWVGIG